jgi:TetR/AcrR family transcriptional repressor of nem operon
VTTRAALFEPVFENDSDLGEQLDRYSQRLVAGLRRARTTFGSVPGCPFGNFAAELAPSDPEIRAAVDAAFADMRSIFAGAVERARDRGEVPVDVDPADAAVALCAHMEGLMIAAKSRDDPAVLGRFGRDARRLVGIR